MKHAGSTRTTESGVVPSTHQHSHSLTPSVCLSFCLSMHDVYVCVSPLCIMCGPCMRCVSTVQGLIYRFSFLMVFTLLCAALTVILFIVGNISEGHWKWNERTYLEYTSAVQTGH